MWELLTKCVAEGGGRVAFCIPWPDFFGGPTLAIYWYGILASLGIFLGAFYASKHVEWEGGDPDMIWDALLWLLVPALLGARLWYVGQAALAGSDAFAVTNAADVLKIFNSRLGGMNIFGGALFGLIALAIYTRVRKIDGWLLADGAMMGLLIGQGIGRFGNYINIELYGPPTGSKTFGMLVPVDRRLPMYLNMVKYPPDTLFHPTMFYEAGWLFLCFGVLFFFFRRYQEFFIHGLVAGIYLIVSGFGRFWIEFLRPDQPKLPDSIFSYSQLLSVLYIVLGLVVVLDRLGYISTYRFFRIFLSKSPIGPPQTPQQRQKAFQALLSERRRKARAADREKQRIERRKQRAADRQEKADQTEAAEES